MIQMQRIFLAEQNVFVDVIYFDPAVDIDLKWTLVAWQRLKPPVVFFSKKAHKQKT